MVCAICLHRISAAKKKKFLPTPGADAPDFAGPPKRKPLRPGCFVSTEVRLRNSLRGYDLKSGLLVKMRQCCDIQNSPTERRFFTGITLPVVREDNLDVSFR